MIESGNRNKLDNKEMMKPPTIPRKPNPPTGKKAGVPHFQPEEKTKPLTLQELMTEVNKIDPVIPVTEFVKKDVTEDMFPEFNDLAYKKNMKVSTYRPPPVVKPPTVKKIKSSDKKHRNDIKEKNGVKNGVKKDSKNEIKNGPKDRSHAQKSNDVLPSTPSEPKGSNSDFGDMPEPILLEADELFMDEDNLPSYYKRVEDIDEEEQAELHSNKPKPEIVKSAKPQHAKEIPDAHFEKRKQMKREKLEAEMREKYSFQPKINAKSKALDSKRSNSGTKKPRYKNLYELDQVLKIREAELKEIIEEERWLKEQAKEEKECTFRPKINSKQILREEETDIAERAKAWQRRKKEKLLEVAKLKKERELQDCTFTPHLSKI